VGVNHPFMAAPPLQTPPHCTFAPPLRNIRPPTHPPPPFYAIHHTLLVMPMSCKGQSPTLSSLPPKDTAVPPWVNRSRLHRSGSPRVNPVSLGLALAVCIGRYVMFFRLIGVKPLTHLSFSCSHRCACVCVGVGGVVLWLCVCVCVTC